MNRWTLYLDTDGAAFRPDPGREVARILRQLALRAESSGRLPEGTTLDVNGNTVGGATVLREDDPACPCCEQELRRRPPCPVCGKPRQDHHPDALQACEDEYRRRQEVSP